MLGLVLRKAKYISSITDSEYYNSMKQLNQAKSSPGSGNYASNEFGISSSIGDIQDSIRQNENIHRRR